MQNTTECYEYSRYSDRQNQKQAPRYKKTMFVSVLFHP